MDIHGIGPAGAARILADVRDVARFPDRNHFASWTGTAPIDASSGQHLRHRPGAPTCAASPRCRCPAWRPRRRWPASLKGSSAAPRRPSGPRAHAAPTDSSSHVPRLHLPLTRWSPRKPRGGSRRLTGHSSVIEASEGWVRVPPSAPSQKPLPIKERAFLLTRMLITASSRRSLPGRRIGSRCRAV